MSDKEASIPVVTKRAHLITFLAAPLLALLRIWPVIGGRLGIDAA